MGTVCKTCLTRSLRAVVYCSQLHQNLNLKNAYAPEPGDENVRNGSFQVSKTTQIPYHETQGVGIPHNHGLHTMPHENHAQWFTTFKWLVTKTSHTSCRHNNQNEDDVGMPTELMTLVWPPPQCSSRSVSCDDSWGLTAKQWRRNLLSIV